MEQVAANVNLACLYNRALPVYSPPIPDTLDAALDNFVLFGPAV